VCGDHRPALTGGPVEMTRDALAVFFNKDGDNTPGFVSMDPVKQPQSELPSEDELRRTRHQME
jgi:hypothetical protein